MRPTPFVPLRLPKGRPRCTASIGSRRAYFRLGSIRALRAWEDRSFAVRGPSIAARWSAFPRIADAHGGASGRTGCRLVGADRPFARRRPPAPHAAERSLALAGTCEASHPVSSIPVPPRSATACRGATKAALTKPSRVDRCSRGRCFAAHARHRPSSSGQARSQGRALPATGLPASAMPPVAGQRRDRVRSAQLLVIPTPPIQTLAPGSASFAKDGVRAASYEADKRSTMSTPSATAKRSTLSSETFRSWRSIEPT